MESLQQDPVNVEPAAALSAPNGMLLKHFEKRLLENLGASPHPSLSLNRLQAALNRALDSQRELKRLLERAPQIGVVLGQYLREIFGHDPQQLLFTAPAAAGEEPVVQSLVQVAMALLRNPFLSLAPGMVLSLSGSSASPLTPDQVLARLKSLGLASRISGILHDYWQQPADGRHVARRERLVELHKLMFHDKVLLAHQFGVLSGPASAMLIGLLDAPSDQARALAGGRWAKLVVSELVWPGVGSTAPVLSGALHLWSAGSGGGGRQVVFVPGMAEEFFEFSSLASLQRELAERLNAPGNYSAWQLLPLQARHELFRLEDQVALPYAFLTCAPLAGDALAHSALSRLDTQLANEWAGALLINTAYLLPQLSSVGRHLQPLQAVAAVQQTRDALTRLSAVRPLLARLLRSDERHAMFTITFGRLSAGISQRQRQNKVRLQERALLGLLERGGALEPRALLDDHEPWLKQADAVRELLGDGDGYAQASFWSGKDSQGVELTDRLFNGRCRALLLEARMQRQLGLVEQPELERLLDALPAALLEEPRVVVDTQVASIAVGPGSSSWVLTGACVISTRQALADPQLMSAAWLFVPGHLGGLEMFASLESLSQQLGLSLLDPECETFWPLVTRDRRGELRNWLRQLPAGEQVPVHYQVVAADALHQGLQQQIQEHLRLCQAIDGGLRPFSEIGDARNSRQMLAHELAQSLAVPGHDAREQALENLAVLQLAEAQARELPAWLTQAPLGLRQRYTRLLRSYQASAQALTQRLEQRLPDLGDFARGKLIERLRLDGFHPGLDIDKPLFDLPDSVERVWVGHPENPAGGSGPKTEVSSQRRTYSFLQLALENLDPQAPGTRLRLQHGRILDAAWQSRLTPDYLIPTISALDLGGQYDTVIQQAFYGVDDSRREAVPAFERALLDRLVRQRARLELFSARQQGLGEQAARLFERALGEGNGTGLRSAGQAPELYFVTFAGRAFAKARHVGNAVAIRDRASGLTLVYLPGAPHAQVLTEHPDLLAAQRALVDSRQASQRATDIAQRLAVGWEAEVIEEYPVDPMAVVACPMASQPAASAGPILMLRPGWLFKVLKSWWNSELEQPFPGPDALEQEVRREITQNPGHWLRLEKTSRSDLALILAHALVLRAQQRARVASNSILQLARQREVYERERHSAYWLRVLSVVPVVSIAVNVRGSAVALRQFSRSGDPRDAFELLKAVHMTLADIALTLYPGAAGARPARIAHGTRARAALRNISRRRTRYDQGAMALKKLAPGTRPAPALPGYVASIPEGDSVALHGPAHAGIRVKNGVQFITDGRHRYEVYQPKGERAPRLKKTAAQPNELILHIREPGEHLLRADAPEPQPGPSRAMFHRPWEERPAPVPAPVPAAVPNARLEWMSRRPVASSTGSWKSWGLALADDEVVAQPAGRDLYLRRDSNIRLLKLDDRYFELLATGSDLEPEIVFLKRPGPLAEWARSDFEHWWSHLEQQPLPVSFDPRSGTWTPRAPLFGESGRRLLEPIAGRMTAHSRARTLNRLIERSEAGANTAVTASRMVALKRRLETWEAHGVDLHVLFRDMEARPVRGNFRIGLREEVIGFSRLDYTPSRVIDSRLFDVDGRHRPEGLPLATEGAVRDVLLDHGFVVNEIPKAPSMISVNLECTHPASEHRYLFLLKWTQSDTVKLSRLRRPGGGPHQLTDNWLREVADSRSAGYSQMLQPTRAALDQGRLVKLVAGLQRVPDSQRVVVFFVRVR